jgi:hypothetical protein
MGNGILAFSDTKNVLFEASNVHDVSNGTNILMVEAIRSDGR